MQRRALLLAAGAGAILPKAALAQAYPVRPVRVVVSGGPGTVIDVLARTVSGHMSTAFGHPLVVDNKPGAEGVVAAGEVARAAPDGYTLSVISSSPLTAAPHLKKKLPYTLEDFSAIGKLGSYFFALAVHPSLPATLDDLMKFARANPDRISYATGNITSILATRHLAGWGKASMLQVPYKSEPLAMTDLLAGRVQLMFGTVGVLAPQVKAGKLRGLAILGPQRSVLLPELPTLAEAGVPPFEVTPSAGVFGPAGLPREIVQRVNAGIQAALADAEVRQSFARQGFATETSTPEELAAFMRHQHGAWARAVQEAGIQPE